MSMHHENIYGIFTVDNDKQTFHYVGITKRPLDARFAQHRHAAKSPLAIKPLYKLMNEVGVKNFNIVLLDTTESGLFESDYVKTLIEAGHPLLNSNTGNKKVSKLKDMSWSVVNKNADQLLDAAALAKTSEPRRNRLHSNSQVLTKPEIVRQRMLNTIPDAETLDAMDWKDAPIELMPFRNGAPKNQQDIICESLKYGDFLIVLATRKDKWCSYIKNTRTAMATSTNTLWGFGVHPSTTRLDLLKKLTHEWQTAIWHHLGGF